MTAARRGRAEFCAALLIEAVGAGGALLVAGRHWQTVAAPDDLLRHSLDVSGRTVDSAPTALALVALAGVVAVLATRGPARRAVGGLVALAGAGLIWRSAAARGALGASRARELLAQRGGVIDDSLVPRVQVHGVWSTLSLLCGVLVLLAGVAVALRGSRWAAMSARYEAPPVRTSGADPGRGEQARADASLWSALDRGDDPTAHDPTEAG